MDVGLVGAGRVGTALAVHLAKAGHRIAGASGRDASRERVERHLSDVPFLPPAEVAAVAEVVVLAVPDDRIAGMCADLAARKALRRGQAVAHLSGALSLDVLAAARGEGATVLCLHPLQTFPDVESAIDLLPGSAFAVTAEVEKGYALGERLAADTGGRPFRLDDARKPLYHAAAVFCSNYLAVVEGVAEELFRKAGMEDPVSLFAPLAEATLANVLRLGSAHALTGPAARGDAGTVRRNLEALSREAPEAIAAYVILAEAALDLASKAGKLTAPARSGVEEVLADWK
jgi:predicted short-subunit dehydrogenase-like oxidoreductase (DUF2520 family)